MATTTGEMVCDDYIDMSLGEKYYKDDKDLEDALVEEIIGIISQFIERRFKDGRRPARRDAHARDNGCVRAIFRVDPDLDISLQQGLFQPGREYRAWIRFSNGNSEVLSGRFPDARGMAIKLTGVPGRKLLDDEQHTQDFILANNPVFFVDDLQRYKNALKTFHSGGLLQQALALFRLRGREILLGINNSFGIRSVITNPLFSQYWSMTSYRLGIDPARKMAVKFTAKPRLSLRPNFRSQLQAFFSPGFSLKHEMNRTLAGNEIWFDFYIQRYVDDRQTPIEDSKVRWSEQASKEQHVAKIIIPMQDCMSSEQAVFCENLSFNPWHCLPEHKPLGAVNRVRKTIYTRISALRHRLNGAPQQEPTGEETFGRRWATSSEVVSPPLW